MLLEHSKAASAVRVSNMAAIKVHSPAAHVSLDAGSKLKKNNQIPKPHNSPEALDDRFGAPLQEKSSKHVQEAVKKLKKHRQDDVKHNNKRLLRLQRHWKRDPRRMEKLRHKFVEQCKRYFGVPYARKYWTKDTPEYKSPLFLDCCGLVRQVMRDLERDFGFRIGPWNQAYMYDTLPIVLKEAQMKPGDLVFMTGTYVNGKHKKQRHNMMHVEVWLGEGSKTIGARWNNGKVQVFDSYKFYPKSFTNEQYLFRSIDTWLMGICKSYCEKHKWGVSTCHSGKKSVFHPQQNLPLQDEKAGDDDDDDDKNNDDASDKVKVDGSDVTWPESPGTETRADTARKKKRNKKGRKVVSRHSFLPQATKTALLRLEDRLDHLVARSRTGDPATPASRGSPASGRQAYQRSIVTLATSTPTLTLVKRGRGMPGGGGGCLVTARPATSFDVFSNQGSAASGGDGPAVGATQGGHGVQLKCPVIGDCNSQPMQYVPNLMPKRYGSPRLASRAARSPDVHQRQQPKWLDTASKPAETERGGPHPQKKLTTGGHPSPTVRPSLLGGAGRAGGGGLLTRGGALRVVGSTAVGWGSLKKNKSCTDLVMLSTKSKPGGTKGATPGACSTRGWSQRDSDSSAVGSSTTTPVWRHSAPDTLNNPLSNSAQFVQSVRDSPATPSLAATYCTEEEEEEEEDVLEEEEEDFEEEGESVLMEAEEEEEEMSSSSDGETSMACDCQSCWFDRVEECGEEEEEENDVDEEEMDTDEELEGYCVMDYALEEHDEEDDDDDDDDEEEESEDDDLAGAALSFTYRSEWNVSESQSYTTCKRRSPVFPLRPASDLPAPRQRQARTPLLPLSAHGDCCPSYKELPRISAPFAVADNVNNNSSRSHSAVRPRRSPRFSATSRRPSTARAPAVRTGWRTPEQPSAMRDSVPPGGASGKGPGEASRDVPALDLAGSKKKVAVVGGSSFAESTSAPADGDEKGGGESGGASRGEPSESEAGGGEEAGGEGMGEGGGGRSGGRKGGKRTPGGRPTKLPACSLPANMTPTFYVGGGNGVALVEGPLLALGWKRTMDKYDERYRLKWVECKSKINYTTFKEGEQLVNHIPNCKLLTNKLGLLCSLQEYERVTMATKGRPPRLKISDFVPETYKLDEKVDRSTFLNLYKEGEIWICKPVGMNQGKGIFLLRSRGEIDNLLAERDAKKEINKNSTRQPMIRIVQRYISNPLLLEGRKFDIRAYMLIASTVPYLVLFHHGYIRLSCLKYDGNDTNLTTHLTNQFMQKKDPNYKDVKEDTAWTMEKFNNYINTHYAAEKGLDEDWVFNSMTKQMQRIMLHCFNSVKHKLQCKIGYFDLYGLDFMIDTDMKVWLIEVNVNPALHINCEALKEVIPGIVEETLYVSIEAFEKSRKNQPLMPMQSLKGFQVLHSGTPLFNIATRQTRSVSPAKGENPERVRVAQTAHAHGRHTSPPRALPRMSVSTTQVQVSTNVSTSQNTTSSSSTTTGGAARVSQTSLPDISHSNTNANQSTNNKPPATTTAPPSQPAASRNNTTASSQQPFSVKTSTASSTPSAGGGAKPSTAASSMVSTPKTASTAVSHKTGSTAASAATGSRSSVATGAVRQPAVPPTDVKVAGDDIRLKMTHANSATSRRYRDKPERGN